MQCAISNVRSSALKQKDERKGQTTLGLATVYFFYIGTYVVGRIHEGDLITGKTAIGKAMNSIQF